MPTIPSQPSGTWSKTLQAEGQLTAGLGLTRTPLCYYHRITELTRLEKTFGITESKMNVLLLGLGFLAALGEASTPEQITDGKVRVNRIPVTTFAFGAVNS